MLCRLRHLVTEFVMSYVLIFCQQNTPTHGIMSIRGLISKRIAPFITIILT